MKTHIALAKSKTGDLLDISNPICPQIVFLITTTRKKEIQTEIGWIDVDFVTKLNSKSALLRTDLIYRGNIELAPETPNKLYGYSEMVSSADFKIEPLTLLKRAAIQCIVSRAIHERSAKKLRVSVS